MTLSTPQRAGILVILALVMIATRVNHFAALLGSTGDNDTVLAVAHAGSIRALLCHALGLPPARALALGVDHAHASRISYHGGQFEVRYMNTPRFLAA